MINHSKCDILLCILPRQAAEATVALAHGDGVAGDHGVVEGRTTANFACQSRIGPPSLLRKYYSVDRLP